MFFPVPFLSCPSPVHVQQPQHLPERHHHGQVVVGVQGHGVHHAQQLHHPGHAHHQLTQRGTPTQGAAQAHGWTNLEGEGREMKGRINGNYGKEAYMTFLHQDL